MALPKLVVFDLDACCWYPEMYMVRRGPPFTKTSEDECKASDGEAIKLLGQTRKVWETISNGDEWQDCRVAVASRCDANSPDSLNSSRPFLLHGRRAFMTTSRYAPLRRAPKSTHDQIAH